MKKFILLISILAIGCSASKKIDKQEVSQKEKSITQNIVTIKNLQAKQHFIQGLTYALQELPEKAVLEFQEALIFEDNPNINFALALQLYRINKLDLSLKYLDKILALPDSQIHPDFLLVSAQIYLTKQDLQKATQILERMIKIDSSNIDALYNFAQLIESKDRNRAKKIYEKILELQPENRIVLENLLSIYYEEKDLEKSEELIKKIIYNEPSDVELRMRLISLYREMNKDNEAKKLLEETAERFPDEPLARLQLIEVLIDEKKYDDAIKTIDETLSQNENDKELKISIFDFVTLKAIKDSVLRDYLNDYFDKRIAKKDSISNVYQYVLKSIKSKDYGQEKTLVNLNDEINRDVIKKFGIQFFYDGLSEQSINLLKSVYDYYEDEFDVNVILGQAHLSIEDYNSAVHYLQKSVDINSQNPDLLIALSFALGKLKKYDEAIAYSEQALSLDNKNHNALVNLGLLLDDAGYFEKSDSIYEEALRYYPDDPTLLNNYAYSLAKRKVNLEKALIMSKKSLEKDSLVDSYLDTLGWIYFQMGEIKEAEKYIKLAIDQGSPSAEILEHMGDVYLKLNQKEEAKEYYRMALKMNPDNQILQQKLKDIE
ncbi:MAG: tetratricopeptide repeat protein [Ignavibacteria bacterium]|jgi:tetratricopeptide (TPR) repeat protein|nr:tetratricopeptide repeat protein [Ignavibacteria bacterium]MDH7527275.1 tetratricopeptide repeat protein [Ignavibacteria bacterium]